MKTAFAICRTQKLHLRDISRTAVHNYRARPVANADPRGSIVPLSGAASADAFTHTLTTRFAEWKARKLAAHTGKRGAKMARDPVVCVEVMLSASPEYFRPDNAAQAGQWRADRLKAWESRVKTFAENHFGPNLVSLVLHLDESTPHAHALVMPFDNTGNLNAKQTFNRQGLIRLQDAYADACRPLGLQRGLRGSTAEHQTVKTFYGVVNRSTPEVSPAALKPKKRPLPGKLERLDDDKLTEFVGSVFKEGVKAASIVYQKQLASVSAKANAFDLAQRQQAAVDHKLEETRKLASQVRVIPLPQVLEKLGAIPDEFDPDKWHLPGRSMSVNGSKFFDQTANKGGTGAIDLVKHCEDVSYPQAVSWLSLEFGAGAVVGEAVNTTQQLVREQAHSPAPLPPPNEDPSNLPKVEAYLTIRRGIPAPHVQALIKSGRLYADRHANAVFKLKSLTGEEGAEIVGTGTTPHHSRRGHAGYFVLPPKNKDSRKAVFVSGALEALSYRLLHPLNDWIFAVVGYAGRPLRRLAKHLKREGYSFIAAFRDDINGRDMTTQLATEVSVLTEVPPHGGWNSQLVQGEPNVDNQSLQRLNKAIHRRAPSP